MSKTRRITVSLPDSVVSDLDSLSSAIGTSRSAFLSALLSQSLPPLVAVSACLSPDVSEGDSRRYRGEFISHLQESFSNLLKYSEGGDANDLFKE